MPAAAQFWAGISGGRTIGYLLVAPTVLFLGVWFVWPVLQMVVLSVNARSVDGVMVDGFTIENYTRLFSTDLYFRILLRTLRIAADGQPLSWRCSPIRWRWPSRGAGRSWRGSSRSRSWRRCWSTWWCGPMAGRPS